MINIVSKEILSMKDSSSARHPLQISQTQCICITKENFNAANKRPTSSYPNISRNNLMLCRYKEKKKTSALKERAQQYPSLYIGWKLQPADLDDFFNNKNILLHCLNMARYKNLEQNQTFSNVYLNRKTDHSRNGAVWMSYNQPDRSIVWGKIVIVRKTVWGIKENNPIYRNFTKVLNCLNS